SLLRQSLKTCQPVCLSSVAATADNGMVELETILTPVSFNGGEATRFFGMVQMLSDPTPLLGRSIAYERLVGSQLIQEMSGEANYDRMKSAVLEVVGQHFRPEFINRIDDIVVFHPLGREHIRRIVDIQVGTLQKRLADREIGLELEDAARDLLGEAGYDPVYGARPLKRAIQQQLENPLAQRILKGEFAPGSTIRVGASEGALNFSG
ncbi:MAG: hypothetical protein ACO3IJ_10855, partial [Steroidobacteraceae bacterium]